MLPGIDLRLQTVLKALEEVVLPAIPADQRLARDQAMLAIGHIRMIGGQWRHAARYEAGSLRAMVSLAEAMLAAPGARIGEDQREALGAAITRAAALDPADLAGAEGLIAELGTRLDGVIMTCGRPGTLPPAILEAVLSYGEMQAHRERVWFSATKLDPDVRDLEDVQTMLAAQIAETDREAGCQTPSA